MSDFGQVYTQFKGKPDEAIAHLMKLKSGEAVAALHHPQVGDIDLVWGEEGTGKSDGYGLAKIVKYHPEVVGRLQEILNEMNIQGIPSSNRIVLASEKNIGVVRLDWNKQIKKWLLTAYERKNPTTGRSTDIPDTSSRRDEMAPSSERQGKVSKGMTVEQEITMMITEQLADVCETNLPRLCAFVKTPEGKETARNMIFSYCKEHGVSIQTAMAHIDSELS